MLKFQSALTAAAGALVVVPAVTLDDANLGSLQDALNSTSRAIEVLTGLQNRIGEGDSAAADLVERVTEPPILDGRARDARLETLRNEVGLLHTELDLLEAHSMAVTAPLLPALGSAGTPRTGMPATLGPLPQPGDALPVSTGLSQADLQALREFGAPTFPPHSSTPGPAATDPVAAPSPTDGAAYSADPIRHARAYLRAGRYQEGVAVLANSQDPEALYLKARCLEKLGRLDEAIEALSIVVAESPEGYQAQRAKSDLEFFQWKQEFLAAMPEEARPAVAAPQIPNTLDAGGQR